jgi:PQQ enzyme repeat
MGSAGAAKAASTAVLTHHYDNYRTGWNQTETTLTPQNVGSAQFGLLAATITLDAQVDAQPLVMPNQTITGGANPGTYEVVYVATAANTVYAINAANGQVLTSRNLGPAVPWPLGCVNNGPTVGITSTPVIDTTNQTLDLIAYTLVGGVPTYTLHALNLGDLTDKIAPVTVAASNLLSNGNPVKFNAQYQRQRPALLYANDAIYARFGSFCDFQLGAPRGWLLGWNASNLTPFAANRLNDTLSASPHGYFLSSIWMSGSGPAADLFGNIYFATGNSDPSGTTYSPATNIANTVAQVSGNLGELISKYTPPYEAILDETDYDLGSGGVLLVPDQSGPFPRLLVAGGKDGNMFLFDRDYLGSPMVGGPNYALDVENNGSCWCAESYFTGPDGIGRVVTSGSTGG